MTSWFSANSNTVTDREATSYHRDNNRVEALPHLGFAQQPILTRTLSYVGLIFRIRCSHEMNDVI